MIQIGQRLTFAGILLLLLVQIRGIELELFYDPFILYFKSDFSNLEIPSYHFWKLLGSMSLRYLLNSTISCFIIYIIFRSKYYFFYGIKFYFLMYCLLFGIYAYLLNFDFPYGFTFSYSIRRLIIQPFMVIILMVGFYYENLENKSK